MWKHVRQCCERTRQIEEHEQEEEEFIIATNESKLNSESSTLQVYTWSHKFSPYLKNCISYNVVIFLTQ